MKKICVYGKGGIGKSTTVANLAAALSTMDLKVAVVGCDPKADSTRNIMGKRINTVLDIMHLNADGPLFQHGFNNIICIESGGPAPATGCAGRGIVVALQEITKQNLLADRDVVIYDVLGDVVCGGFATPLRENVADEVYIVTTSDFMSLYATNNICRGIEKYAKSGSIRLSGIIYNGRSSLDNPELVGKIAAQLNTKIVGYIPMSSEISKAEFMKKTVIEQFEQSEISAIFKTLATSIMNNVEGVIPTPISDLEMEEICENYMKT